MVTESGAVLASSASRALRFLAAPASLATESQSPVETMAQIPQKPRHWLDKAPVPLRFQYWWGRLAPEPHGFASHLLNNRHVSVASCQLLSYLPAHRVQHTISWGLQQLKTVKCTVRIQTVCGLILYTQAPCFDLRYHLRVSPLHAWTLLHPKPMEWIYL